jgi:hypothetical protein
MDITDRFVVVPSRALGDLLGLVDRACPDLDETLASALRGAVAEIRSHSLLEPV